LYRQVPNADVGWIDGIVRAKRPPRVPVVLSQRAVRALLGHLRGTQRLGAQALYGNGLRLLKGLRLRVKNLDFERGALVVRSGTGRKDRMSVLSESLHEPLQRRSLSARKLHGLDVADGVGTSNVRDALGRIYPTAEREWAWQYVFPSHRRAVDHCTEVFAQHHLQEKTVPRAVKQAVRVADIARMPVVIRCGTPSPLIRLSLAMTSAQFKSSLGMWT
jgi:integrase